MDDLATRARHYATSSHGRINHLRKYTLQPYDVHLKGVAQLVASVTDDQAMIAASWLHDTVEDTAVTFEEIEREFGSDIMQLVKELTDVSKPSDGNRSIRKEIDRQHSAQASPRAKTVKLADLIDNCEDICRHDPEFGRVYLVEMQALLQVLTEGDQRLYARAVKVVSGCADKLGVASSVSPGTLFAKSNRWPIPEHGIRLFVDAFSARDILEPLLSFDDTSLHKISSDTPVGLKTPVFGIRSNGLVTGYVIVDDLSSGAPCEIRQFDQHQTVDFESSLADVIHILTHFRFCFVELDGTVIGVISRGDIEKPVVRMWLFGIIILIEILIVDLIRTRWPEGSWGVLVSSNRLEKASQLRDERIRRGQHGELLDCLQFSDKIQLVLQNPEFIRNAGFTSQSAAKKSMKDLESLRNNLAHGQDITRHDWAPIVRLAQRVQELYRY